MKIVAINGSPRKNGNTHILIQTMFDVFKKHNIETLEINIAQKPLQGCTACDWCEKNLVKKCVINDDIINSALSEMDKADGIILASPVYFADMSGQMKSFIDRAGRVCYKNKMLKRKVGAGIVALRRGGAMSAFQNLNNLFTVLQMIVVGSSYWNLAFGKKPGEVKNDKEGIESMQLLAENMAWVLKKLN